MLKTKAYTAKKHQSVYDLALLLAHGQSRYSENQWDDFIDHLSRICDEFAKQTNPDVEIRTTPTTYPSQLSTTTTNRFLLAPQRHIGRI